MKSFEELKKELGKDYDVKLYEMGISAMEENQRLKQALDEIEKYLNKRGDDLVDDYSLFSETSFYDDLKEIIKKAKGGIDYAKD